MSVSQYLQEKGKPTRRFVGGFAGGTREITYNDLNPRERQDYDRWAVNRVENPTTMQSFLNSDSNPLSQTSTTTNYTYDLSGLDLSFKTFLREKGYKDYVRTGLFRRKRAKTLGRASDKERREYYAWKKQKEDAEKERQRQQQDALSVLENAASGFVDINATVQRSTSQRELENKKRLEQIERIDAVDLSLEISNYLGSNEIESKYPGLVQTIQEAVVNYGNTFREEEIYAEVVVTNTINTRNEVLNHIEWMTTPPTAPTDVELRDVNLMGSWVLQTTETVGLGGEGEGLNLKTKPTEEPNKVPPKTQLPKLNIPINEIRKDSKVIEKSKVLPFDRRSILFGRPIFGKKLQGSLINRGLYKKNNKGLFGKN